MREQLAGLLDARSNSETKILYDQLREIRSGMISNGVYTSSMHINAAMRVCADYMENYAKGAVDDYKRTISADSAKYSGEYLRDSAQKFLDRLSVERDIAQGVLQSSVGGIANALSNTGLQDYKAFDTTWKSMYRKAKAETEIFNAEVLQTKPSLLSLLKDKWESHPVVVFLAGTSIGLIFIAGLLEAVQKINSNF